MIIAVVLRPSDLTEMYSPDLITLFLDGALKSREIKMRSEKIIEERRLAFRNKTIDEILSLDKANAEVDYEDIRSISL